MTGFLLSFSSANDLIESVDTLMCQIMLSVMKRKDHKTRTHAIDLTVSLIIYWSFDAFHGTVLPSSEWTVVAHHHGHNAQPNYIEHK